MKLHLMSYRAWLTPAIVMVLLISCIKQEHFSDIPEISYREFLLIFDTGQYALKGCLSFNFQDGDGDIGLNPNEIYPPYDSAGGYYYNLVIRYFEKQEGIWVEIPQDPPLSARIPVLNPTDPGKAIKGFIVDTLYPLNPMPVYDTVMFEFFIYDRALHQSNILFTPEISLRRPV